MLFLKNIDLKFLFFEYCLIIGFFFYPSINFWKNNDKILKKIKLSIIIFRTTFVSFSSLMMFHYLALSNLLYGILIEMENTFK
jgi:hypothetical protein